jgi:hypothetical protein
MLEMTPEVIKADGQNRVAKTAGQSGTAGALILVGLWVAHQAGWQGDMPADVIVAWTILLTSAASAVTNLGRLRGRL